MKDARNRESQFFLANPAYKDLDNTGTSFLANKLSVHLINEIHKKLPTISSHIDQTLFKTQKELEALGTDIGSNRGRWVSNGQLLPEQAYTTMHTIY